MGVLSRLRAWLGLEGETGTADPDGTDADGLDPDNVTEVRSDADDEAVEKLRTVRERQSTDEDDGSE